MKTSIKFAFILVVIVSVILILLTITRNNELRSANKENIELQERSISIKFLMESNLLLEYLTNGLKVSDTIKFEDPYGKSFCLDNLPIKNKMVLLYLEETFCSDCYNSVLEKLQKEYPKIVNNELIVICSFMNFRGIIIYFKENKIKIPLYNIVNGKLNFPAGSTNAPFIAILDKGGYLENCCIIQKEELSKVDIFLKAYIQRSGKGF